MNSSGVRAWIRHTASGRLIAGAIAAMLVLWVQGVAILFSPFPALRVAGPVAVAALVVLGSTISEVMLTWTVFPSAHDFFHLP